MSQLLPYETIVKASEGDPEAVAAVLSHYACYPTMLDISEPVPKWTVISMWKCRSISFKN